MIWVVMSDHELREPHRLRVTLDIDLGVEPLSGILTADGVEHPFNGWLELVSTLGHLTNPEPAAEENA